MFGNVSKTLRARMDDLRTQEHFENFQKQHYWDLQG